MFMNIIKRWWLRVLIVVVALVTVLIAPIAIAAVPAQAAVVSCSAATPTASLPTLHYGDSGSCVIVAQQALIRNGISVGATGADGSFGPATLSATKRFQAAKGLVADGVIGQLAWSRLRGVISYNRLKGPNYTSRVILTFDDCPVSLTALKNMLVYARAYNIGLVLAPTGNCIVAFRSRYGVDIAPLIRSYGQYAINHSISHPDLTRLSYAQIITQLRAPGVVTNYGRPPYGATNSTVSSAYAAIGMREWLWTVDTRDWTGKTQAQVVSYVIANTHVGDTVLMHMTWHAFNPTALLQMRSGLASKGLSLCRAHVGASPVLLPNAGLPC
jgi:peptidoglycan/xylan/chitin deacetylase (PgdA/CDA1 family)